jgi:transposase InsO family protein
LGNAISTVVRWLLTVCLRWLRLQAKVCARHGRSRRGFRRASRKQHEPFPAHWRRKPDWVREEILSYADRFAEMGCRALADLFNRRHVGVDGWTVSKTFVSDLIRDYQYAIQQRRREWRRRRYFPGVPNRIWGVDGTGKTDAQGRQHFLLGVIDHGTRRCLDLQALKDKATITILRALLDAIEQHGRPKVIRTDNEAIFRNPIFRFVLKRLRIRHQRTDLHSPWQNGRIERFFGTLKAKLDRLMVADADGLNDALCIFRYWYNQVRPHQHLQGRTPHEVWHGMDIYRRKVRRSVEYEAWDGLLQGECLQG